jgi:hypothetical protein
VGGLAKTTANVRSIRRNRPKMAKSAANVRQLGEKAYMTCSFCHARIGGVFLAI